MSLDPIKEFNLDPAVFNHLQNVHSEEDLLETLSKNHELLGVFLGSLSREVALSKSPLLEKLFTLVTPQDLNRWAPELGNKVKIVQLSLLNNKLDAELKTKIANFIRDYTKKPSYSAKGLENELRSLIVKMAIEQSDSRSILETFEKSSSIVLAESKRAGIRPVQLEKDNLTESLLSQIPTMIGEIIKEERSADESSEALEGLDDYEYDYEMNDYEMDDFQDDGVVEKDEMVIEPEAPEDTKIDIAQMKTQLEKLVQSVHQTVKFDPSMKDKIGTLLANELNSLNEMLRAISKEHLLDNPGKYLECENKVKAYLQLLSTFHSISAENPKLFQSAESLRNNVRSLIEQVFLPSLKSFYLEDSEFDEGSGKEFQHLNSLLLLLNAEFPENWGIRSDFDKIKPKVFEIIQRIPESKLGSILDSDNYEKLHRDALSAIPLIKGFINNPGDLIGDFVEALQPIIDTYEPYKQQIQNPKSTDVIFDSAVMLVRTLIADAVKTLENRLEAVHISLEDPSHVQLKRRVESTLKSVEKLLGTDIKLEISMETEHDALIALLSSALINGGPNALEDARSWVADGHDKGYDFVLFAAWLESKNEQGIDLGRLGNNPQSLYNAFVAETSRF